GRTTIPIPVGIARFHPSTPAVYKGDPVTLSWSVEGDPSLELDPPVAIPSGAGSVVVTPDRTTTYTLTASKGADVRTAQVTVIVQTGEPVAHDLIIDGDQGAPVGVTLKGEDPNPPPGGLSWQIVQGPVNGTLEGVAPELVYTPNSGFHGT